MRSRAVIALYFSLTFLVLVSGLREILAATNVPPGPITVDTVWDIVGSPYVISSAGLTIDTGATLAIKSGVLVKFDPGDGSQKAVLLVQGKLVVEGTQSEEAVFTSLRDDSVGGDSNGDGNNTSSAPGDWAGICFADGSRGYINHAVLRYGGSSDLAMVHVSTNASTVSVTDTSLSDTTSRHGAMEIAGGTNPRMVSRNAFARNLTGLVLGEGGGEATVEDNSFSDSALGAIRMNLSFTGFLSGNTSSGTGRNGIWVEGGMSSNVTWGEVNMPYIVDCRNSLNVPANVTWTISPGVVVKFNSTVPCCKAVVSVSGRLQAEGTRQQKIVFTSVRDDTYGGDTNGDGNASQPVPGDWAGIWFNIGATGSISNAVLRYGGESSSRTAMITIGSNNSSVHIADCLISDGIGFGGIRITGSGADTSPTINGNTLVRNSPYGISVESGRPAIIGNTISGSPWGVYLSGDSFPLINFNDIENNSIGVYNAPCPNDVPCPARDLDATRNYWGAPNGPSRDPDRLLKPPYGDQVSWHVNFEPYESRVPDFEALRKQELPEQAQADAPVSGNTRPPRKTFLSKLVAFFGFLFSYRPFYY